MKQIDFLRQLALSLPETAEEPHFEKTSFRVKKKIFATYNAKNNLACIKFSEIDQDVFSIIDKKVIYPVPNKWGKQGWTFIELDKLENGIIEDALKTSYCEVAPKKLSERVRPKDSEKT
jgi:predicted DNA-binding protein (MmcQ/YjbR family)